MQKDADIIEVKYMGKTLKMNSLYAEKLRDMHYGVAKVADDEKFSKGEHRIILTHTPIQLKLTCLLSFFNSP